MDTTTPPAAPHIAPSRQAEPRESPHLLAARPTAKRERPWLPKRVMITRSARDWPVAARVAERAAGRGVEIVELKGDRITGLKTESKAETYRRAKSTLAVVVAPPSTRKPQPIPPSADWRFDLATGCPAHCQYCYLAGSLSGPPVTRLFANLPEILDGLPPLLGSGQVTSKNEARAEEGTTFEASCYTDPLAFEHLAGSLSDAISWFGRWDEAVQLRFTTKFSDVAPLLKLDHRGRTRVRFSVNAGEIVRRFEGGTASLAARLQAMGEMARAGYPVGLTVAPIMPLEDWQDAYDQLFAAAKAELPENSDLTGEFITHRFTPGSKEVLLGWYPATSLEMDEAVRSEKRTKFGSKKYVYPKSLMDEMKRTITERFQSHFPHARALYWT